jgi:acyl-CoA synthetase (AMP-forming)/AMP-acid ligase II
MLLKENYNVRKGETVAIGILDVNHLHLTSIIACAELGLKIFLIDAPATEESLPYTKIALHGPVDYLIHDNFKGDNLYGGLHGKMIREYSKELIDARELKLKVPKGMDYINQVSEDDIFLISSTSGSTKPSRKIEFTHKEIYAIAKRNIDIFKLKPDTKILHSKNMHHVSAMLCTLLPSLMIVKKHRSFTLAEFTEWQGANLHLVDFNHVMIPNEKMLDWFVEFFDKNGGLEKSTVLVMCGFTMTKKHVDMCKRYNIEFISHYGSVDTAIPLLVNYIDGNSECIPDSLGVAPDDFYEIDVSSTGHVSVNNSMWSEKRSMDDILEIVDSQYILKGRIDTIHLDELVNSCPEPIDLNLFSYDTKINMEQLRGHIKNVKKRLDNT